MFKNDKRDFNIAFADSVFQKTFVDLVKDSIRKKADEQILYYDFYSQAYHSLDLLGISKDQITKKNNYSNLLNGGLHSYYARYCDYFVTSDSSSKEKSEALYDLFQVHTKVVSVEEFIHLLP